MSLAENTIWSLMAGGLLSLATLALADAVINRSLGAMRNLLLTTSIGLVSVLLSGLPETFLSYVPERVFMVLKAGMGPLAAALGLRFLGIWIQGSNEDRFLNRISSWGCTGLMVVAFLLMGLAVGISPAAFPGLLSITALVNAVPVVLTMMAATRAVLQGDTLARWLLLASLLLAVMVGGLYLKALGHLKPGLWAWVITAGSTVTFVLIMTVLIIVRNQQSRRLARLARLESGHDPATGLATGAKLVSEAEHMFWRAGRLRARCLVMCVYLGNLYELGDSMGRTIDNQILVATSARLRRAVGFRCLMGMFHPRCFILVFLLDRRRQVNDTFAPRVRAAVSEPLMVVGNHERRHLFVPQVGVAMRELEPDEAHARDVIHEVERLAMEQLPAVPAAEEAMEPLTHPPADTAW